ncbi:MAG: hybrid sensor histidine kinase/response regulator [Fibrobacteres bacterium]|nr:hybrid sensor histidine kinase/response regulator [Fibrobacterota bacterium]
MGNPRILVVEDESAAARDLQARLRDLGYRVSAIDTAEAGPGGGIPDGDTALAIHEKKLRGAIETALQQHAMETKLQESQEWFFTTLRSIGDAVVASDEKGRITFLNPQAEALTGWSLGEACGRPLGDVLRIERRAPDAAEDRDAYAPSHSAANPMDADVVARDGDRTPVEAKSALIRESNGHVMGVVRILRDVTDRKRAEEVFRRSERRYRNLVEKSQDIIFTLSREGIITSLNPAFEKSTGWSSREWLYRPFAELLNPADAVPAWEAFRKVLRGEFFPPQEMRLRAKPGGEIVVECGCAPAIQDDRPGGIWGIARDITQRKNLEQRVLQTQKMEAVGRLAGGIAHDFNNLLTTINGHADLLSQALGSKSPLVAHAQGILGSVDKAAALTRQLLSISRQQTVSPRNLDLNSVISRQLPGLTGLMDENIELILDLDPQLAPVLADINQIERVISILIANSRDAMPRGGKLTVSTSEASGQDWRPAFHSDAGATGHVILSVRDTGIGMGDEIKARLFEPFFTTKPIGKGAGLGLSTVYGIVKSAGGDIQVESSPGKGTAINLLFPRLNEPAVAAPAAPIAQAEIKSGVETILLVEDDDDVRFLLSSILKADGYSVLEAKDGEQALEVTAASNEPINLVLTDLQMPKLGGRRLVEKLLTAHPGMKAVFMSGFGREDFPDAQANGLPVSFLEKPFMPKSLVRQIRKVLDA